MVVMVEMMVVVISDGSDGGVSDGSDGDDYGGGYK